MSAALNLVAAAGIALAPRLHVFENKDPLGFNRDDAPNVALRPLEWDAALRSGTARDIDQRSDLTRARDESSAFAKTFCAEELEAMRCDAGLLQ